MPRARHPANPPAGKDGGTEQDQGQADTDKQPGGLAPRGLDGGEQNTDGTEQDPDERPPDTVGPWETSTQIEPQSARAENQQNHRQKPRLKLPRKPPAENPGTRRKTRQLPTPGTPAPSRMACPRRTHTATSNSPGPGRA
ncbi:hypothetical protein GCM10010502_74690 [Kitasatospora aureofaciens]|uniref:Uncharacterized protein n=1 Tax=Kitasatospora aureofaciens TaxID=1894 RepID=A0A8H9I188_KITAU|nr:hypothetical protein GCM10010502_74690 [Kitasatospora aureofaciens]